MKKNVKKNNVLDLDTALEQVAKKLRPTAQGACGTTALYFTDPAYDTANQVVCKCYCCSDDASGSCDTDPKSLTCK